MAKTSQLSVGHGVAAPEWRGRIFFRAQCLLGEVKIGEVTQGRVGERAYDQTAV